MALLGYARVSTQGQDLTAQIEALKATGAETIYKEKVSGVRADRPATREVDGAPMPGDILAVTKLDRLGRSTRELLELIERIGKAGAAFRSLGDPLWDTTSSRGRLLSTLLAAIADFERDLIRERRVKAASALWPMASNSAAHASYRNISAPKPSSGGLTGKRSRRSPRVTAWRSR